MKFILNGCRANRFNIPWLHQSAVTLWWERGRERECGKVRVEGWLGGWVFGWFLGWRLGRCGEGRRAQGISSYYYEQEINNFPKVAVTSAIPSRPTLYHPVPFHSLPPGPVPLSTTQSRPTLYHPVPSHSISFARSFVRAIPASFARRELNFLIHAHRWESTIKCSRFDLIKLG